MARHDDEDEEGKLKMNIAISEREAGINLQKREYIQSLNLVTSNQVAQRRRNWLDMMMMMPGLLGRKQV